MASIDVSVNCSRVRAQVSLQLDDELSQLESRMMSAHLARCHDCRLFAEEVEEFTLQLRAAPPVALDRPIAVSRPRRVSILRMQAGVAAVLAVVAVGLRRRNPVRMVRHRDAVPDPRRDRARARAPEAPAAAGAEVRDGLGSSLILER
jgi:hypothetical protein